MKTTRIYLLLLTALSLSFAAKAQTADDIIDKYVDAIGGKDKLAQIKSVYTDATISVMGQDGSANTTLLVGKGYRSESEINGQKIIQVYTDKGGWSINPFAGGTDPAPMPDDQYQSGKDAIWLGRSLLDYAARGYKAELLPKDGNNYPIKITAGTQVTTYFIDANTYLLNKMTSTASMQGQDVNVTTSLSDYKKTDFGELEPYKVDIDFGQFQLDFVVKSITINKDIDPKIFDMPK
ncbi:MAG TPA: hypothetical protein VHE59_08580 [Mucilaginibacter sp.]|nr:hypothetical protein [Mucilaginibacter sp.]